MNRTRILTTAVGTMLVGATALCSSVAAAGSNVAWSVSIGGPGFAVSAGQPVYGRAYYGGPYRPYYRPYYRPVVAAAPVYRPWYAPVAVAAPYPVYAPAPVVYAPPVVVARRPYVRHVYPVRPYVY